MFLIVFNLKSQTETQHGHTVSDVTRLKGLWLLPIIIFIIDYDYFLSLFIILHVRDKISIRRYIVILPLEIRLTIFSFKTQAAHWNDGTCEHGQNKKINTMFLHLLKSNLYPSVRQMIVRWLFSNVLIIAESRWYRYRGPRLAYRIVSWVNPWFPSITFKYLV